MISHLRGFRASTASLLLAILILGAAPAASQAGWLGFRNDLNKGVIIRTAVVVKGRTVLGRPKSLQSGEVAWDVVLQPGIRVIQVFDAKQPAKALYQGNIPIKGDLFYSIQLDRAGNVQLTPTKAPVAPPGRNR